MNVKQMKGDPSLWVGHKRSKGKDIYVYGETQREAIELIKAAK